MYYWQCVFVFTKNILTKNPMHNMDLQIMSSDKMKIISREVVKKKKRNK